MDQTQDTIEKSSFSFMFDASEAKVFSRQHGSQFWTTADCLQRELSNPTSMAIPRSLTKDCVLPYVAQMFTWIRLGYYSKEFFLFYVGCQ